MSDTHAAPEAAAEAIAPPPVVAPAQAPVAVDVSEAARQMAKWRNEQRKPAEPPPAPKEPAAEPPKELAEKPTSDPPQEAPAETTEEAEPAELPPIEPPRSWTKEEKEEFLTYPREAQEKIARREQDRETALRRSQNEAAEKLKGLSAKEEQAERVRQQYETALPSLLQLLQEQQQGEFSDIKTMADVEKLAREDWPRYALWDAQQKKIAAVSAEVKAAQDRQTSEYKSKWAEFSTKEDAKAVERIPELADKDKAAKIANDVMATLERSDITRDEFAKAWTGEASISPRDARWQEIMVKAARYDQAKANVAKPAPKPVPPVQRPGVAPQKGAEHVAQIEAAKEKLSTAKGNAAIDAAFRLYQAQKAARR